MKRAVLHRWLIITGGLAAAFAAAAVLVPGESLGSAREGNEEFPLCEYINVDLLSIPVSVIPYDGDRIRFHWRNDVPLTVVLTYGGATGGAVRLVAELARRGNKNLRGVYAIQMPENYTLTFTTPKIYEKLVLRLAEKKIDRVTGAILRAEPHLPAEGRTRETLYEKNKSNWHLIGRDFSATEDCMQCGKCAALCPVGNIVLENGKVRFGDRCVACLGCYHRCPQKAIVYKHRRKKDRYINPKIREAEIGENF